MKKIILIFILCISLCGCSPKKKFHNKTIYAMDTVMTLKVYSEDDEPLKEAENEIKRIESLMKRSDKNSEIYSLNNLGSANLSEETAEVINEALKICESTNGDFDITIAPVMDIWGFYGQNFRVPSLDEINFAKEKVNYRNVHINGNKAEIDDGSEIDLGGIAKGYTSDKVSEILKNSGVDSAILSLGGNVQAVGTKPDGSEWNIAIQDPQNLNEFIGSIKAADKSVITSGGYQRFFEENGKIYHHIIDPKTGYPSESGLISVSVVCESGIYGDGLSTSLFVMGLDKAVQYWRMHNDFNAVFVTDDGSIYITEGIKDVFSSSKKFKVIQK